MNYVLFLNASDYEEAVIYFPGSDCRFVGYSLQIMDAKVWANDLVVLPVAALSLWIVMQGTLAMPIAGCAASSRPSNGADGA
jgi:hypothetical protein